LLREENFETGDVCFDQVPSIVKPALGDFRFEAKERQSAEQSLFSPISSLLREQAGIIG
jgi:hypothetical protein